MSRQSLIFKVGILIILLGVIIDQLSKTYFISELKNHINYTININEYLDIVYAWNYGVSFGFLREYYQYSNSFFLGINVIITFLLFVYFFRLAKTNKSISQAAGMSLIISGAIGNIIDRSIRGAVFDFIYLNYNGYHFPAFNFADGFITIGAITYFIAMAWEDKSDK